MPLELGHYELRRKDKTLLFKQSNFWRALVLSLLAATSANSLDPDQDRQNVGPDLDPNSLILW